MMLCFVLRGILETLASSTAPLLSPKASQRTLELIHSLRSSMMGMAARNE